MRIIRKIINRINGTKVPKLLDECKTIEEVKQALKDWRNLEYERWLKYDRQIAFEATFKFINYFARLDMKELKEVSK